ncbi:MAG: family 10 glycosylhydrolase [Armatimonadota bacterium]|nr:family 10 glycosylhydrolase [Armatimonadota bacterium]
MLQDRRPRRGAGFGHGAGAWVLYVCCFLFLPMAVQAQPAELPLISAAVTRAAGLEGRLVWVDGYANMDVLGSRAGIAALMEQMRRARVNTVVLGAKMFGGQTLFPSEIAPQLIEWRGQSVPADLNILQTVIEEAHARGLKVHASIDVFSDGHRLARKGPAYEHPEWQTVVYSVRRELVTPDGQRLPIYAVNPPENLGDVVTAYTPGYGWRKPRNPDRDDTQVYAILAGPADDMRILAVVDCALVRDNQLVEMPRDGLLLYGRGALADWMLRALRVGDRVQFVAVEKFLPIASDELEGAALFLNPVLPEVRQRALRQIEEIARKFDVDGIVFDRMRFSGINADFSDYTRARFEEHLGRKVEDWPHEILRVDPIPGRLFVRGPLFNVWVEWRAAQITSFLKEAVALLRGIKPNLRIGAYVGSWYDRYYGEGVNWASPDYSGALDWMNATYGQTGYARELDYITTGCYYRRPTRESALVDDAPVESTVEAAAQLSARVVSDAAFVYGGLDLNQYESKDAAGNRRFDFDSFRAGIAVARANTQGVMIFDTVHLNRNRAWGVLEEAFSVPTLAPHDVPELLPSLRRVREVLRGGIK